MKVTIPIDEALVDTFLPANRLDGSGLGVNYADAYLKAVKTGFGREPSEIEIRFREQPDTSGALHPRGATSLLPR